MVSILCNNIRRNSEVLIEQKKEGSESCVMIPSQFIPLKGWLPRIISQIEIPQAQMSLLKEQRLFLYASGLMYKGLPTPQELSPFLSQRNSQKPRSATFRTPSFTKKFAGLMSLWMMALLCKAVSPLNIISVNLRILPSSIGPLQALITDARSPSQNSLTKYTLLLVWYTSIIMMTFGCLMVLTALTSLLRSFSYKLDLSLFSCTTLMATTSCVVVCVPLQTFEEYPLPSRSSVLNLYSATSFTTNPICSLSLSLSIPKTQYSKSKQTQVLESAQDLALLALSHVGVVQLETFFVLPAPAGHVAQVDLLVELVALAAKDHEKRGQLATIGATASLGVPLENTQQVEVVLAARSDLDVALEAYGTYFSTEEGLRRGTWQHYPVSIPLEVNLQVPV